MKLFTLDACERLISHYEDKGGNVLTVREGVLGLGTVVLTAPNLKTAVIKERPINDWSSGHAIRLYSKTPKKYLND
jgi:hypothetical protein